MGTGSAVPRPPHRQAVVQRSGDTRRSAAVITGNRHWASTDDNNIIPAARSDGTPNVIDWDHRTGIDADDNIALGPEQASVEV
jgi:hypothetical protein